MQRIPHHITSQASLSLPEFALNIFFSCFCARLAVYANFSFFFFFRFSRRSRFFPLFGMCSPHVICWFRIAHCECVWVCNCVWVSARAHTPRNTHFSHGLIYRQAICCSARPPRSRVKTDESDGESKRDNVHSTSEHTHTHMRARKKAIREFYASWNCIPIM